MTLVWRYCQVPLRPVAVVVAMAACTGAANHDSMPRGGHSSIAEFMRILKNGESLYGLGVGCEEWRAKPGELDVDLSSFVGETSGSQEADEESDETGKTAGNEDHAASEDGAAVGRETASLTGHLVAGADNEGRIYTFAYDLHPDRAPLRIKISGRGGWTATPDAEMRNPENPDAAVIGVGSYCTTEVDVLADPKRQNVILVGDEKWYLTRDACLRFKRVGADDRYRHCSKMRDHSRAK